MDHPSLLHTMNHGYPTREPEVFRKCTYCGEEMFHGEEIVVAAGYPYCDEICYAKLALEEGTIERVIAGE